MIKKIINYVLLFIIPLIALFITLGFNIMSCITTLIYTILYIRNNKSKNIYVYVLSFIYSLILVFGYEIETYYLDFSITNNFLYRLLILYSLTIFINYILNELINILNKISISKSNNKVSFKTYLIIFSILLICYIPYLITSYPGLLDVDSFTQIKQALGIWGVTNQHPVVYIAAIRFLFYICSLFKLSLNNQIFTYTIIQMLIMIITITYSLVFLYKRNTPKRVMVFFIAFYAILPIFGFFSVTMWKDILFSCFALLLMLKLYELTERDFNNKDLIILFILVLLTSFLRSNGRLILLGVSIILLVLFKQKRKEVIISILIPTLICFFVNGPVYNWLGVTKANRIEALGIPVRQMLYVVYKGEDKSELHDYIIDMVGSEEELQDKYSLYTIDNVKFNDYFKDELCSKGILIPMWLKGLKSYPISYIESYMSSTYGFWYPNTDGYSIVKQVTIDKELNIRQKNHKLSDYYDSINSKPIIKYLLRAGTYILIMFFIIMVILENKKYKLLIPLLIPLFNWATVMLSTPISYNLRYVFISIMCIPFELYLLYKSKKND